MTQSRRLLLASLPCAAVLALVTTQGDAPLGEGRPQTAAPVLAAAQPAGGVHAAMLVSEHGAGASRRASEHGALAGEPTAAELQQAAQVKVGVGEVPARPRWEVRRELNRRLADPGRRCPLSLVITLERIKLAPDALDDRQLNDLYDRFCALEQRMLEEVAAMQASPSAPRLDLPPGEVLEDPAQARWQEFLRDADALAGEYAS